MKLHFIVVLTVVLWNYFVMCGSRGIKAQRVQQSKHKTRGDNAPPRKSVAPEQLRPLHVTLSETSINFSPAEWQQLEVQATNFSLDFEPRGQVYVPVPEATPPVINPHIIGGTLAGRTDYPYMTRIMIEKTYLCGGCVISNMFVLTAAHCTAGFKDIWLTFGVEDMSQTEVGRVTRKSAATFEHPHFNITSMKNDIAIIKLAKAVAINTAYVAAVRLPKRSDVTETYGDMKATICGFGLTAETTSGGQVSPQLKHLVMNVIPNPTCVRVFGKFVTSNNICCEVKSEQATCNGDSGGPLTISETDNIRTVVGIVSFGSSAGCTAAPSAFTRVVAYLGWISDMTNIRIRN